MSYSQRSWAAAYLTAAAVTTKQDRKIGQRLKIGWRSLPTRRGDQKILMTPAHGHVFLALVTHTAMQDMDGKSIRSDATNAQVAETCFWSVSQVEQALADLERVGFTQRRRRHNRSSVTTIFRTPGSFDVGSNPARKTVKEHREPDDDDYDGDDDEDNYDEDEEESDMTPMEMATEFHGGPIADPATYRSRKLDLLRVNDEERQDQVWIGELQLLLNYEASGMRLNPTDSEILRMILDDHLIELDPSQDGDRLDELTERESAGEDLSDEEQIYMDRVYDERKLKTVARHLGWQEHVLAAMLSGERIMTLAERKAFATHCQVSVDLLTGRGILLQSLA